MTTLARRRCGPIEVALVNNMPDQALSATRNQFARLVQSGSDGRDIIWRCYALPGIARSDTARRYLERSHEDIAALYRRGADALIVTGCEPRAARLDDEPYWPHLQRLIDWARDRTVSTIWSCLAAHAAALHLDGIERRRADRKVSGVFTFETTAQDWRAGVAGRKIVVPHSRYNGLAQEELEGRGYKIASFSHEVGVDVFWREEPSLFLFLQGHPEYDADTLLKEYRRDVLRYFSGERADYPEQPQNTFSTQAAAALDALQAKVVAGVETAPERKLAEIFAGEKREAAWLDDTARLYRDWLRVVSARAGAWRDSA